jgi:hypothetical protein
MKRIKDLQVSDISVTVDPKLFAEWKKINSRTIIALIFLTLIPVIFLIINLYRKLVFNIEFPSPGIAVLPVLFMFYFLFKENEAFNKLGINRTDIKSVRKNG